MLFSGTTVVSGRCLAVVTSTGANTELGRIKSNLSEMDEVDTPLQRKLAEFGDFIGKITLGVCAVVSDVEQEIDRPNDRWRETKTESHRQVVLNMNLSRDGVVDGTFEM